MKTKLHPGAKWLFRITAYISVVILVLVISGFIGTFIGSMTTDLTSIAIYTSIIAVILIIILGEIYTRMTYNRWFYEFTPTGLKIEKGIIWKTYKNIPYQRIQNIDINRGIIARICGFSTVDLQTAGYAYSGHRGGRSRSEGHIPAVDMKTAEEIREYVMSKISSHKSGV